MAAQTHIDPQDADCYHRGETPAVSPGIRLHAHLDTEQPPRMAHHSMGLVVLAMCGQSLGAQVFANTMFCTLGKISLSLFLSHHFYAKYWDAIMPSGTPDWQMATWYLLAAGITTAAVMGGALLIRRIVAAFHTPH